MEYGFNIREQRPVLIHTSRGALEGDLEIGAALRTLDRLNLLHHAFVTIENPQVLTGGWSIESRTLVLNTSCILFVVERKGRETDQHETNEAARFSRSAVRLHVGEFEIRGFLHVPGDGKPLVRLKQDQHSFLAITSASVVGPDAAFASSFVAVNRAHVLAAQELNHEIDDERIARSADSLEPALSGGFEGGG